MVARCGLGWLAAVVAMVSAPAAGHACDQAKAAALAKVAAANGFVQPAMAQPWVVVDRDEFQMPGQGMANVMNSSGMEVGRLFVLPNGMAYVAFANGFVLPVGQNFAMANGFANAGRANGVVQTAGQEFAMVNGFGKQAGMGNGFGIGKPAGQEFGMGQGFGKQAGNGFVKPAGMGNGFVKPAGMGNGFVKPAGMGNGFKPGNGFAKPGFGGVKPAGGIKHGKLK